MAGARVQLEWPVVMPAMRAGGEAVLGAAQGDLGQHPAHSVVDAGMHFAAPSPPWPTIDRALSGRQFAETDLQAGSVNNSRLQNELLVIRS
jgi:hypothetical protein